MASPEEPGWSGQVLAWVASGIAAIGAWLWMNTMGRIAELEKTKVNQQTFDAYVSRADKDRDERRQTELSLFEEMKDQRLHFDGKLDRLADLIRERKCSHSCSGRTPATKGPSAESPPAP